MKRLIILATIFFIVVISFGVAQTGGFNGISSDSKGLISVSVPFPVYSSGRLVLLGTPWWLLLLVFMVVFPLLEILVGMVPPFSKSPNDNAKIVFSLGLTLLSMFASPLIPNLLHAISTGVLIVKWWIYILIVVIFLWLMMTMFDKREHRYRF